MEIPGYCPEIYVTTFFTTMGYPVIAPKCKPNMISIRMILACLVKGDISRRLYQNKDNFLFNEIVKKHKLQKIIYF